MKRLTRRAAKTYLEVTRMSFLYGLIGWAQLLDRLKVLVSITLPGDPCHKQAARVLVFEKIGEGDTWAGDDIELPTGGTSVLKAQELDDDDEDDGPLVIYFFPGPQTGLSEWEFHQYDDDYFPSVPHGHFKGADQPKLDPYLGWIYRRSQQVDRVHRKKIVALWNDDKFRLLASSAIRYYLEHHPHYSGWRVTDPLALPRRR